ncbi:hypothetical protein H072_7590 [Dactylellina haptotyla CBS 200.50]|uniref:F-box domain-containing protein n=1 Tax=Dactylellina haptotyla (strain CBS 200.50) TaxID=1284197 RepID=S8BTQ0_DACHA|nr:hypothetical protein H072_7590 [Dactylellina haptotyla CBS 200.50]
MDELTSADECGRAAASSSQVQVLVTNELLENILAHLPALELVTTIRSVCKRWRTLLDGSPVLRWATWRYDGRDPPPSIKASSPRRGHQRFPFTVDQEPDGEDQQRIADYLLRNYEYNPLLEDVVQIYWKRLFTLPQDQRKVPGLTPFLDRFLDSICHLKLQLSRPVFPQAHLAASFGASLKVLQRDEDDPWARISGRYSGSNRVAVNKKSDMPISERDGGMASLIRYMHATMVTEWVAPHITWQKEWEELDHFHDTSRAETRDRSASLEICDQEARAIWADHKQDSEPPSVVLLLNCVKPYAITAVKYFGRS